ncbi:MAG TPA: O-antigen ligase family protein [Roseiflexaceae bacterium]
MALGLALFYRGGGLGPAALGIGLFGGLALLRPDLGLLFVPLTAPLYLIPAAIQGLRADSADPFRVPLHEAALLAVAAATAANWLWRRVTDRRSTTDTRRNTAELLWTYAPHALFLVAGALGAAIAVERAPALREFRWLIVEPLIFYTLLKYHSARHLDGRWKTEGERRLVDRSSSVLRPPSSFNHNLLIAFVLSGAIAGLLGLLQYAGRDLVPLLGRKQCFAPDGAACANIVADGGVRRVLSVYGSPNNLGLYLGRVWPLAAALAICDWRFWILDLRGQPPKIQNPKSKMPDSWFFALCSLLCLGGIVVSFSRGAWLGAIAAGAVLALGLIRDQRSNVRTFQRSNVRRHWLLGLAVAAVVLGGLALSLRGDVTAGSTPVRLLLWREALGYIRQHPFGIGLDQFVHYHDPDSGLSLIDPALIGTSEQYAAHPHNLVLDIWLRLGPLGLAAFAWLLARFFRAALPRVSDPVALGALAAIVAALAHGLVDNFYFVPDLAVAFWLLIELVENVGRLER